MLITYEGNVDGFLLKSDDEREKTYFCTLFLNQVVMDWTILNTIVTIVSIVVGVVGISAVVYYLFPKIWRKKYLAEHTPTPHFEQELEYGGIYVQPKIEMEDKDKKKIVKLLREYFFNDVFVKKGAKEDKKVFCILGDTGMGKTAALVNLFVDYVKHYRKGNIPYDIWLYSLADQNVFEKINAVENKGKSILLLDAVDENDEAKDDNTYNDFIKKLELAYQDFAFVVTTCRPQFFGDESEVFNTTRAKRDGFFLKCKRLDLVQFDEGQVREYLFNLYYHEPNKEQLQKKAERIIEKCPKIAQRPLVLSYINELVSDENKNYETTLDIYDAIVTKLIERETNKTLPSADEKMIQQWRDLLSEVAGYMYKNNKLSISLKEYEDILSKHKLKMPEDKKTFRQRSLLTSTADGFHFSYNSVFEYLLAYRFFESPDEIASIRDIDFALQIFDELYDAYKLGRNNKVSKSVVADSLYRIGNEYHKLNSLSKAEQKYKDALKEYQSLEKAPLNNYQQYKAKIQYNLGDLYLNSTINDLSKAYPEIKEFKDMLEESRDLSSYNSEELIKKMPTLPSDSNSRFKEADDAFSSALDLYRDLAKSTQDYKLNEANTLIKLCCLHVVTDQCDKAKVEWEEAFDIYNDLKLAKVNTVAKRFFDMLLVALCIF